MAKLCYLSVEDIKKTFCNVGFFCKNEACVNCGTLNAITLIWLLEGPGRPRKAQKDPERPKKTQQGFEDPERPKKIQEDPGRPKKTQKDPERSRKAQKGPRPKKTQEDLGRPKKTQEDPRRKVLFGQSKDIQQKHVARQTDRIADFYSWQVFCLKLKKSNVGQRGPIV